MGYLEIPASSLGNFSKAVISFWFRIPSETFASVGALTDAPSGRSSDHMCSICYSPALYKIIPLITFGSLETDAFDNACQPSFVGVDCALGMNTLAVNLQTPVSATDAPLSQDRAECFYMSGSSSPYNRNTTVSADQWHHALISFDISGSASVDYPLDASPFTLSSTNTFSWALDDSSRQNISLNPSGGGRWAVNGLSDPGLIIPQGLIDYAGAPGDTASVTGCYIGQNGNPIGIPTSTTFVASVCVVEMAELQFYTGVTLATTNTTNRRAFVTAEGRPETDYTIADALLGKSPEIRLHGRVNWKAGTNTGTTASFSRTGTINDFSPGPSIS